MPVSVKGLPLTEFDFESCITSWSRLKKIQKMDERLCFVYDLDWKCYKNGGNDTKSKKKKKGPFWRSTIFDHLPPCGFVLKKLCKLIIINEGITPLYFFFSGDNPACVPGLNSNTCVPGLN